MIKKIGVLSSGGDAPGMNAAIRAVVRTAIYSGIQVIGYERGYQGLLENSFYEMNMSTVSDILQRGGTILKTARSEEFKTKQGQKYAKQNLEKNDVDALVVIGGDGSFRGALELCRLGVQVIGIPGTIDNDIYGTDYTIGFDTSVNTVLDAINKIRDTASSHERIFVVECMGRDSGWIALEAGLSGGAEAILVPEKEFTYKDICRDIREGLDRGKVHSIIVVAEGASNAIDVSKNLENHLGLSCKYTVLGHTQRGGSPTAFDRILASKLGYWAVEGILKSKTAVMVGISGNKKAIVPFEEIGHRKKELDLEMMDIANILGL